MEQIAVTHVSKDFPDASGKPFHALRDISFAWTKGENISLMGESGSGKSTMAAFCWAGAPDPGQNSDRW